MGLSTIDLGSGGSKLKNITPGNYKLKINKIALEDFTFIKDAKHLVLSLETEPLDNFEGFFIDYNNQEAGRYLGQIGDVRASQYAFADGFTKSGIAVNRDKSLMIFLKNLCDALEISDWFKSQNNLHSTIEDFVDAFNNSAPFKDKYLHFCVAGKEYTKQNGYTGYVMWLPKSENRQYAYSNNEETVITYDANKHLTKSKPQEVEAFGTDLGSLPLPKKPSTDFNLD